MGPGSGTEVVNKGQIVCLWHLRGHFLPRKSLCGLDLHESLFLMAQRIHRWVLCTLPLENLWVRAGIRPPSHNCWTGRKGRGECGLFVGERRLAQGSASDDRQKGQRQGEMGRSLLRAYWRGGVISCTFSAGCLCSPPASPTEWGCSVPSGSPPPTLCLRLSDPGPWKNSYQFSTIS